jgi:hypothetical protein
VQSGDAGWGKERKSWDSSELRVPEVRHRSCPRGTDIASRLLRKPKNSYMLLILSEKNINIVQEDRKARFIVKKKCLVEKLI